MRSLEFEIHCPENYHELLIYELSQDTEISFLQSEHILKAYIPDHEKIKNRIVTVLSSYSNVIPDFSFNIIPVREENWNKLWESNFEPVVLANKYIIIAPFHHSYDQQYQSVLIQPEMAFGTGHHATTALMTDFLIQMNVKGKSIIDFGCGTGILSIISEKEGAGKILAIDNDSRAVASTGKNIRLNHCNRITVKKGTLQSIRNEKSDMILANITKNTILRYLKAMGNILNKDGSVICSGFRPEDFSDIEHSFQQHGFRLLEKAQKDGWGAAKFKI